MSKPRGRLAPSPTGVLHLGNARSFLLAWLDMRARGGEVVLRIEDLDGPRIKTGASEAAITDLQWLGLDWDEGPYTQRDELPVYQNALRKLQEGNFVYSCNCSRKDIEQAASAPHEGQDGVVYPGTCRHKQALPNDSCCWRFAFQEDEQFNFVDRFCGAQSYVPAKELGDFVVWKRDQEPAYQLAVVIDDARQEITDVLRGDDLLPSTPRQIAIYRALGLTIPTFCHVPLVVGEDGKRLAKRHGDTTVRKFREQGMSAKEMVGMLASWCGLNPQGHALGAEELIADFSLDHLPQPAVVWSEPEH